MRVILVLFIRNSYLQSLSQLCRASIANTVKANLSISGVLIAAKFSAIITYFFNLQI